MEGCTLHAISLSWTDELSRLCVTQLSEWMSKRPWHAEQPELRSERYYPICEFVHASIHPPAGAPSVSFHLCALRSGVYGRRNADSQGTTSSPQVFWCKVNAGNQSRGWAIHQNRHSEPIINVIFLLSIISLFFLISIK